jgi:hypothetical protein
VAVLHSVVIIAVMAIGGAVGVGRLVLRPEEALLTLVLVGGPCISDAIFALLGNRSRQAP